RSAARAGFRGRRGSLRAAEPGSGRLRDRQRRPWRGPRAPGEIAMQLTLRGKLLAIVGAAGVAFVILIVASELLAQSVGRELQNIESRLLPKIELRPRLEGDFDKLRRALQDAVQAYDNDALNNTRDVKEALVQDIAGAKDLIEPGEAANL